MLLHRAGCSCLLSCLSILLYFFVSYLSEYPALLFFSFKVLFPLHFSNWFHFLLKISLDIVLEYVNCDPNAGVIYTCFQILHPKPLNFFRIYSPNPYRFFSSSWLFLWWHYVFIVVFIIWIRLISLLCFLDDFYK